MDMFSEVLAAFAGSGGITPVSTQDLYQRVAERMGIDDEELQAKVPIGKRGHRHSPVKRKIRWFQQSLKEIGVIERVEGERGLWRLTDAGEKKLTKALPDVAMLAFSTDLGIAIWGSCHRVFPHLDVPIMAMITSPPFPLRRPRAYGNPDVSVYTDFICRSLEPVVANLAPEGSVVINLSQDIFVPGTPARSTYLERLVIAIEDRLGLSLMDRVPWCSNKPPGPMQWSSKKRVQMNVSWEPMLWFALDPMRVKSDNRRVLQPHTETHLKLLTAGGEQRTASYGDGAYRLRPGSYGKPTAGRIPRNVITMGNGCPDHRQYRRDAERLGLPPHGAPMPKAMYDYWIQFLTEPGDLCADIFGGRITLGKSAEELGRRWVVTEIMLEYTRAAAERFAGYAGFELNQAVRGFRGSGPDTFSCSA
jgi:site-specific DNA-methyltransferase (cytosine-N4-specific)